MFPDSPDGARHKHGALERRKYGLLVLEEREGDPAAAEPQERGDGQKATMGTGGMAVKETDTGDRNGQRTLLACSQTEYANE